MFTKVDIYSNLIPQNLSLKQELPDQEIQNYAFKTKTLSEDEMKSKESSDDEIKTEILSPIKQEIPFNENFIEDETEDANLSPEENLELSMEELDAEINKDVAQDALYENETTVYKCPMCNGVFKKLPEYKEHKKKHYINKRTCNICKKVLQSLGKLEEHMNKHLGIKPFKCDECDKAFISVHYMKLHKKCHNTVAHYKCMLCPKSFRTMGSLRCHQVVHAEKTEEFRCKVCSIDCENATEYKSHMAEHGKKSEIQCGLCKKTFNTDRGLEAHLSSHKELNFPCEYCGKIFTSMYRIKRHIKRTHMPNKCQDCGEVFYERHLLTKHRKLHISNQPHECQYCQKVFEKAKNLGEHIRLQHKQDGELKKCDVCGKEFINNALLKNHVKTHDKTFQCTHCDRVFSSRSNLEVHFVTHSGARNHKCDICNKLLRSRTSLKNHIASHSEERQFQCEICAKTFKTNRRLYVHKMCHATEEKYQCEICLQKFRVKQYLKFHMNRHSKVKPFECDICKKRFKHKKSRDKHMRIGKHKHVTDDENDCDFCDETFSTRDQLLDHFAEVHHKENIINSLDEDGVEKKVDDDNDDDDDEKV